MKIILDECLPRPLAAMLTGHEVKTVRQMRWSGKANGELLEILAVLRSIKRGQIRNIPTSK